MIKILIIEDEKPIANLIKISLSKAGYSCKCVYDGILAADEIEKEVYDLILLDVMLPGADGFELMEYIGCTTGTPVIFITAKGSIDDKVKGLKMGAEDYIVKPFEIIELLVRVEVVLRRYNKLNAVIEIGGLTINTVSMTVKREGKDINLTNKEYEILLLFAQNPNRALYCETIYERVWGGEYKYGSRTVSLHVQRMRKKVGWEDRLHAVYKVGYRLEV